MNDVGLPFSTTVGGHVEGRMEALILIVVFQTYYML